MLVAGGLAALLVAAFASPAAARAAAEQDWPPFVLVTGLLLVGLVADTDGLFSFVGHQLARTTRSGVALFLGASLLVGLVTATLNLDTSVAFLTPVLVYAARSFGSDDTPFLYACLLCSNAGSLFLPGSNLTNLIVLGQAHESGGRFLAHMWGAALAALVVTGLVVAGLEHRVLRPRSHDLERPNRPRLALGLPAVFATTLLVLLLRNAAIPVVAIGLAATAAMVARRRLDVASVREVLGLEVLIGLFAGAVALGTLGRTWHGPAQLLTHLDAAGTAAFAAVATVLVNNLPAASLLAARAPVRPYALLVGLNLGPNLFVTGSLAWLIWLRSALRAGAKPSLWRASRTGLLAVPLSIAAAIGVLALVGVR